MVYELSDAHMDELSALISIFNSDFKSAGVPNQFFFNIAKDVTLHVGIHKNYPHLEPPTYDLVAPGIDAETKKRIHKELIRQYYKNFGMPTIHRWILCVRDIVSPQKDMSSKNKFQPKTKIKNSNCGDREVKNQIAKENIFHGDTIYDRKSVFQAHFYPITSPTEIPFVLEELTRTKKIRNAKHNVTAYRIRGENGAILQDSDDDGERLAGGHVLRILEKLEVTSGLVIVTRWFGGVQIGGDRFRHYCNAAAQLLVELGHGNKKGLKGTRS